MAASRQRLTGLQHEPRFKAKALLRLSSRCAAGRGVTGGNVKR